MDKVCKARVASDGIEVGMHIEKLQNGRPLLIAALEPGKCLLVVAESQVGIDKRGGWNVTGLPTPFQFGKKPEGIGPPARMGVGANQHTDHGGTAVGESDRLFEDGDSLLGMSRSNEIVTKKPVCRSIVRLHCQNASQGLNGLIEMPCMVKQERISDQPARRLLGAQGYNGVKVCGRFAGIRAAISAAIARHSVAPANTIGSHGFTPKS